MFVLFLEGVRDLSYEIFGKDGSMLEQVDTRLLGLLFTSLH